MLDLFTVVWGVKDQSFLDLMLPSLLQPGNIPAAREYIHTYSFYTNEKSREKIEASPLYEELSRLVEIVWELLQKGEWDVNSNTLHQMRKSAHEQHYMFIASPEDVIGNGSLKNLIPLLEQGHNPVLYQLPRTRDSSYLPMRALLTKGPITSRELVSFTVKHLYWRVSHYPILAHQTGKYLEVWHPTPTPILRPDDDLVALFATNWGANWGYDNCLPYIMIERGYPWSLIPHSDIYFHIEVGGWSSVGPSGVPMNSPCCAWQIAKANACVSFFDPRRYPNEHLRTIWQPARPLKPRLAAAITEKIPFISAWG